MRHADAGYDIAIDCARENKLDLPGLALSAARCRSFAPAIARPRRGRTAAARRPRSPSTPEGASLDTFDWRISMARVASDGPFSEFPGIDRTLAVVEGSGMVLTIGDQRAGDAVTRLGPGQLCRATSPTSARLTAGESPIST